MVERVVMATASEPAPATLGLTMSVSPHPLRGVGTVRLTQANPTPRTRVVLFDVLGRQVAVLHDGPLSAGGHVLPLDATDLPSGLYLVRAESPRGGLTQRVTVVR